MEDRNVRRGDIYHADLDPVFGSEQGGYRPVLVIQNNIGNKYLSLIHIYSKREWRQSYCFGKVNQCISI